MLCPPPWLGTKQLELGTSCPQSGVHSADS